MDIKIKQKLVRYWFSVLQDIICLEIENLEKEFSKKINRIPKKFKCNKWNRSNKKNEGGGNSKNLNYK